jgi:putative ABC transport system permease protein
VLAGIGFAGFAALASWRLRIGLDREILIAAARAGAQLTIVGAAIALVFKYQGLAFAFVTIMIVTAALTAGGRLAALPRSRSRALISIALPALTATGLLLLVGAFAATPRATVPTAGILIGGAMTATTLVGRQMLHALTHDNDQIEARLCLGDNARAALAPSVRVALRSGLIPTIDQTRSVGLVALPGTFVGLILGGASPESAAVTQFVVLLALLAVQLTAGILLTELTQRTVILPGERVLALRAES